MTARVLRNQFTADADGPAFIDAQALEECLTTLMADAKKTWSELDLPEEIFLPYVRERLPEKPSPEDFSKIHSADLYLACACVHGISGAFQAIESQLNAVARALERRRSQRQDVDDVLQIVRSEVLAPAGMLRNYRGQGALLSWLRVVATRIRLRMQKGESRELPTNDEKLLCGGVYPDPELEYSKEKYSTDYKIAISDALASLDAEKRTLLRMHLLDGLSAERIAALRGVHRVTASNWLAEIRRTLALRVKRSLKTKFALRTDDVAQLASLVESRLDITLKRLLSTEKRG